MLTCLDCRKYKRCMESDRLYPCTSFRLSDKMTFGKATKLIKPQKPPENK